MIGTNINNRIQEETVENEYKATGVFGTVETNLQEV